MAVDTLPGHAWFGRLGLAIALSVTVACSTALSHDIADLRLASVRKIDPTKAEDAQAYKMMSWLNEPLLVVEMVMDQDLLSFIKQGDYSLHGTVFFCDRASGDRLENDPYVYDDEGIVERERDVGLHSPGVTRKKVYRLFVRLRVEDPKQRGAVPYDLRNITEDVCVQLRGGRMYGGTYASNVLRLSSNVIRDSSR